MQGKMKGRESKERRTQVNFPVHLRGKTGRKYNCKGNKDVKGTEKGEEMLRRSVSHLNDKQNGRKDK